jgi:hypothetical protein
LRFRRICLDLPEVEERPSHGAPTFFIRGKVSFATLREHGHHDIEFPFFVCAAPPGVQGALVMGRPDCFFVPAYVGHRGWVGVRLDRGVGWAEIEDLCEDAYRSVAPKRLLGELDAYRD